MSVLLKRAQYINQLLMENWFITWGAIGSRYSSAVMYKQICFVQYIFVDYQE